MLKREDISGVRHRSFHGSGKPRIHAITISCRLADNHDDFYAANIAEFPEQVGSGYLVHGNVVNLDFRQRIDPQTEKLGQLVKTTGTVGPIWSSQDIGIAANASKPLYVAISNATGGAAAGGSGVMYIDDIALYRARGAVGQ